MEKIAVTKTELIWPGKYPSDDALRAIPSPPPSLHLRERFSAKSTQKVGQEPWRNKLIWGDNLLAMRALLEEFTGKIDLIYIDPPFATGADFLFASPIGAGKSQGKRQQSVVQEKAYRDTWGRGLSFYLHLGWDISSYVLMLMNEVFGEDCLQNVIIYNYGKFHHSKERWKRDFDAILFYSKDPTVWTFNHDAVLDEYQERTEIRFDKVDDAGRRYKIVKGRRVYYQGGVTPSSVWRLSNLQVNALESLGYPTQKTEELLAKIITASSNPGDLIADFFCGSGTMLTVAEKLGRRWIGCDLGRLALHTTRKRLLSLADCQPFELVDLGKAERQHWWNVTFSVSTKDTSAPSLSAYHAFILKLYGAQPVAGFSGLHGKKGKALVYVGAVDTTISPSEIRHALDTCCKCKRPELHVLGWEWEHGVERLPTKAQERGVKLYLLQIPREIMERRVIEKGDISFFALASLEVACRIRSGVRPNAATATIMLKNFV
ncbi:MAG: site-specific DNA-methyltransferase, partial [Deltaproteobacteria bacterium]|nr:site-specific DNA-methyltransferase [Deltaproteobacteria bacterium]